MNPIDDLLPEEQKVSQSHLIARLQKIYRTPGAEHFTEQVQTEAIARVKQRLAKLEQRTNWQPEASRLGMLHRTRPLRSRFGGLETDATRQKHLMQTLAAVLVVGILLGATIVLFALRQQLGATGTNGEHPKTNTPQLTMNEPSGTPTTVSIKADGLNMSFKVTAGPYFLSELLAVDMELTNSTPTVYIVNGDVTLNPCSGGALWVNLTGGNNPSFSIPAEQFTRGLRCPGGHVSNLYPGQTIAIRQYISLKRSGLVTLKVGSQFASTNNSNAGPLPVHQLTLQLTVSSYIPASRIILVQRQDADVRITVPQATHPQLASIYAANCQEPDDCGNYIWQPLSTNIFPVPYSSYRTGPWNYAVGAVGFAIVTGIWSS